MSNQFRVLVSTVDPNTADPSLNRWPRDEAYDVQAACGRDAALAVLTGAVVDAVREGWMAPGDALWACVWALGDDQDTGYVLGPARIPDAKGLAELMAVMESGKDDLDVGDVRVERVDLEVERADARMLALAEALSRQIASDTQPSDAEVEAHVAGVLSLELARLDIGEDQIQLAVTGSGPGHQRSVRVSFPFQDGDDAPELAYELPAIVLLEILRSSPEGTEPWQLVRAVEGFLKDAALFEEQRKVAEFLEDRFGPADGD